MSQASPNQSRQSRWSQVASAFFVFATLAFLLVWNNRSQSGIEQLISRATAVGLFACLWILGGLCLTAAVIQAWRKRWTPRLPRLPILLAVGGVAICGWIAGFRATPERLVQSAEQGDVVWVKRCLRRGVNVDARYRQLLGFGGSQPSATALGAAAYAGRLEVVKLLIEEGADLEAADQARWTPCLAATVAGHVDVVASLLDAGASLSPRLLGGESQTVHPPALALALRGSEAGSAYPLGDMLRLLIREGADPGSLALHRQALWGTDPEVARTFEQSTSSAVLEPGPLIELLRALARGEDDEAIRLHARVRAPGVVEADLEDAELLQIGARHGRTTFVEHLLDQGVPVDATFARGRDSLTALHRAVVQGQAETVELLVQRGADIERRDEGWGTALHRACTADRVEVGALLIRAGADLEAPRDADVPESPLFSCVATGSLPFARLLLESGADAAAQDARGRTPCQRAQARGMAELAELLSPESWIR